MFTKYYFCIYRTPLLLKSKAFFSQMQNLKNIQGDFIVSFEIPEGFAGNKIMNVTYHLDWPVKGS